MRVPGLPSSDDTGRDSGSGKGGGQEEWPAAARRLAKLSWAIAFRVRKEAGTVEASMALADDNVMLLCQGLEVLEALSDCSGEFFEGRRSKCEEMQEEEQRGRGSLLWNVGHSARVSFRSASGVSCVPAPDRRLEKSDLQNFWLPSSFHVERRSRVEGAYQ